MSAQIIFLHGPSSSGKSTTARSLQNAIELPFWHISIDHLRDGGVLPTKRIKNKDFIWSDMRTSFFDGFHASLAAYAHAGNNLIVEHILDNPDWVPELRELLQPFDVYFVGLHCDLETLKKRELAEQTGLLEALNKTSIRCILIVFMISRSQMPHQQNTTFWPFLRVGDLAYENQNLPGKDDLKLRSLF